MKTAESWGEQVGRFAEDLDVFLTILTGIGVTIAILSSTQDRGQYGGLGGFGGISRAGALTGVGILGGSVVVGLLMTKGKEVRLDQNAIVRLKLERPLSIE